MVVQRLFLCLIFCAIRPIWFVFTLSCCSFSYSNYVSRSLEVIRQCRERERERVCDVISQCCAVLTRDCSPLPPSVPWILHFVCVCVRVCVRNGHSWDYFYRPTACVWQLQEVTFDPLGVSPAVYRHADVQYSPWVKLTFETLFIY